MQANAHHVFYRIATEGNRGHRGRSNSDKHGQDANGAGYVQETGIILTICLLFVCKPLCRGFSETCYISIFETWVKQFQLVFDLNHMPLTTVSLNPARDFGFFHVRGYPASLRNIDGSTQVPAHAWNNVQRAPEVFLHQWNLEK